MHDRDHGGIELDESKERFGVEIPSCAGSLGSCAFRSLSGIDLRAQCLGVVVLAGG